MDRAPDAEVAVLLVPARTNARWFHAALDLAAVPRFFLGRPKFGDAKASSPSMCSCSCGDDPVETVDGRR